MFVAFIFFLQIRSLFFKLGHKVMHTNESKWMKCYIMNTNITKNYIVVTILLCIYECFQVFLIICHTDIQLRTYLNRKSYIVAEMIKSFVSQILVKMALFSPFFVASKSDFVLTKFYILIWKMSYLQNLVGMYMYSCIDSNECFYMRFYHLNDGIQLCICIHGS